MASAETTQTDSPRVRRYRKAAELLDKWMADDTGYDERTWLALEEELKDSAARCRDQDETSP
jgi:hypothetical protein